MDYRPVFFFPERLMSYYFSLFISLHKSLSKGGASKVTSLLWTWHYVEISFQKITLLLQGNNALKWGFLNNHICSQEKVRGGKGKCEEHEEVKIPGLFIYTGRILNISTGDFMKEQNLICKRSNVLQKGLLNEAINRNLLFPSGLYSVFVLAEREQNKPFSTSTLQTNGFQSGFKYLLLG